VKVYLLTRQEGYETPKILSVRRTMESAKVAQIEWDREVQDAYAREKAKYPHEGYGERDETFTYDIVELKLPE
jgi:hypothetical protein